MHHGGDWDRGIGRPLVRQGDGRVGTGSSLISALRPTESSGSPPRQDRQLAPDRDDVVADRRYAPRFAQVANETTWPVATWGLYWAVLPVTAGMLSGGQVSACRSRNVAT